MTVAEEPRTAGPRTARTGLRRAGRRLSGVLMVAGVLLLIDAGLTVVWQEPLSGLYAAVQQGRLDARLGALRAAVVRPAQERVLAALPGGSRRIAFAARALGRTAGPGEPVGRLRIPALGLSQVVVQGTRSGDLRKGPGHYSGTPLPGAPGTAGIAGHRTTYGAPFRHVDDLRRGDPIVVEMPYATITYRVERLRVLDPAATWVVDRRSYDRLVLTACHPLYSAARRIVVFARLVSARPSAALS